VQGFEMTVIHVWALFATERLPVKPSLWIKVLVGSMAQQLAKEIQFNLA
jgi:hypothetical protein